MYSAASTPDDQNSGRKERVAGMCGEKASMPSTGMRESDMVWLLKAACCAVCGDGWVWCGVVNFMLLGVAAEHASFYF